MSSSTLTKHARTTWLLFALSSALTLGACNTPAQPGEHDAGGEAGDVRGKADGPVRVPDAGSVDAATADLGAFDADAPHDTGKVDSGEDAGWRFAGDWVEYELAGGGVVAGELVATYDTSVWWNPLGGDLYALFDATNYAAFPNDRSFRFVEATDVVEERRAEPPTPRPTYRQFLRNQNIAFQRPPFDDDSFVITAHETYHLEEDGYGNFAWDLEITDDDGNWYTGTGAENTDYLVWGAMVRSGVAGTVIDIVQDGIDNVPGSHPQPDVATNNWVGIALGGHFYAYYLHFQENGVEPSLAVGDFVQVGDPLGVVGNSGVSLEPHMHVVLLWYDDEADRSYSVPVEFNDIESGPSPTGPFERFSWRVPDSNEWLRP